MKYRKILILLIVFVSIFIIYILNIDKKINYVALGDSLALGQNPYGEMGYGYADFVANYLEKNNLLKFYTKKFSKSGARINDLMSDLKDNKQLTIDNKVHSLKVVLNNADLVTMSIGANDFLSTINFKDIDLEFFDDNNLSSKLNKIYSDLDGLLKEIRKYAHENIVIIGYYNPLPRSTILFSNKIDQLFASVNQQYQKICDKYNVMYIDIYNLFKNNIDYLPNPIDIHPNNQGYEAISRKIIDILEQKILN